MDRVLVDEAGCWIYPTVNENGYGVIGEGGRGGRTMRTHRVAYELLVGPIPDGLDIDHLCRVRACCNPEHLEPVDRRTNLLRGLRKTAIAECKNGHPLVNIGKQRGCPVCASERSRRFYEDIKSDPDRLADLRRRQRETRQARKEAS